MTKENPSRSSAALSSLSNPNFDPALMFLGIGDQESPRLPSRTSGVGRQDGERSASSDHQNSLITQLLETRISHPPLQSSNQEGQGDAHLSTQTNNEFLATSSRSSSHYKEFLLDTIDAVLLICDETGDFEDLMPEDTLHQQ